MYRVRCKREKKKVREREREDFEGNARFAQRRARKIFTRR